GKVADGRSAQDLREGPWQTPRRAPPNTGPVARTPHVGTPAVRERVAAAAQRRRSGVGVGQATTYGDPGLGVEHVGGRQVEDARPRARGVAAAEREATLSVDREQVPRHAACLA